MEIWNQSARRGIVIDSNKSFFPVQNFHPLVHLLANFVSFLFFLLFFLFFSLPEESRRNFENGGSTPRVSVTFTHDDIISRVRDSRPPLSRPRYRDVARIFISRSFPEIFLFPPQSFASDYHLNSKKFKNEWISISSKFPRGNCDRNLGFFSSSFRTMFEINCWSIVKFLFEKFTFTAEFSHGRFSF